MAAEEPLKFISSDWAKKVSVKKHNVILLKDVPGLGIEGQEVSVKFGYGRNYLLRQKIAVRSTEENLEKFVKVGEATVDLKELVK